MEKQNRKRRKSKKPKSDKWLILGTIVIPILSLVTEWDNIISVTSYLNRFILLETALYFFGFVLITYLVHKYIVKSKSEGLLARYLFGSVTVFCLSTFVFKTSPPSASNELESMIRNASKPIYFQNFYNSKIIQKKINTPSTRLIIDSAIEANLIFNIKNNIENSRSYCAEKELNFECFFRLWKSSDKLFPYTSTGHTLAIAAAAVFVFKEREKDKDNQKSKIEAMTRLIELTNIALSLINESSSEEVFLKNIGLNKGIFATLIPSDVLNYYQKLFEENGETDPEIEKKYPLRSHQEVVLLIQTLRLVEQKFLQSTLKKLTPLIDKMKNKLPIEEKDSLQESFYIEVKRFKELHSQVTIKLM